MAILQAMQSAAVRLIGRKPGTFFGSTQTFELEICDLINEAGADIAQYQDWQALVRIATLTGDGSLTAFNQPTDYDRQLLNADIQQSTNWVWGFGHIQDMNTFIFRQNSGWNPLPGGWIIYQNQLHFSPAPSGDAQFPYITKNWAIAQDGTSKPAFTTDSDSFALNERLLTLWLVWRWRENKKLDASGDQEAFVKALDEYAGKDAGSSIMRFNGRRRWPNASLPYMGVAF